MRYFNTLPVELREKAWNDLGEHLIQQWVDRWLDEPGQDLESHIEEYLLYSLSDDHNLVDDALGYYAWYVNYTESANNYFERITHDKD